MDKSLPDNSFQEIEQGIGSGLGAPKEFKPLASFPLLIFVGLTGVGKTTIIKMLSDAGCQHTVLPNRRVLADRFIITPMQGLEKPCTQELSRLQRFEYTRAYQRKHPGLIAHILAQLWLDPSRYKSLIFDGLRGENEISYAIQALPKAHFLVLDAPNIVRIQRLLNRNDPFDQLDSQQLKATQIILEEAKNYNIQKTLAILQQSAPKRTQYIDTSSRSPEEIFRLMTGSHQCQ